MSDNPYNLLTIDHFHNQLLSDIGLTFFVSFYYCKHIGDEVLEKKLKQNSNYNLNIEKIGEFSKSEVLEVLLYAKNEAGIKIETNQLSITLEQLKDMAKELLKILF